MKVHLNWIHVVAMIAAAGWHVSQASAQYAPYRPQQQPLQPPVAAYPTTGQPAVIPVTQPVYPGYRAAAPQAQPVQQRVQQVQAQAPQVAAMPYAYPTTTYQAATMTPQAPAATSYPQYSPAAAQMPAYSYPQTAQAPTYPSSPVPDFATHGYQIAQQAAPTAPSEQDNLPAPAASAPLPPENGESTAPAEQVTPAPTTPAPTNHPGSAAGQAGCGCNTYPSTGYQTATGYAGYGQGSSGYTDYGISDYCNDDGGGHQWYGGVYWLFMERDNPSPAKLAVRVDHNTATDPYYPQGNTTVLSTLDTEYDFQEGVEVRFGSTFSLGGDCDSGCGDGYGYGNAGGCGPGGGGCAPDNFAWEVAWWGLDEDRQDANYVDIIPADNIRMYGMVNFAGLQYDRDGDGTGWRPLNDYYGYGLPIDAPAAPVDGDIIVLAQRVRTNFSCQNIELNVIRFPVCNYACGGGDSCGYDACGYDTCGCEQDSCPVAFSMYGMCGLRYFRMDDDFYLANEFGEWSGGAYDQAAYDGFGGDTSSELYYDINVDNNLLGPQVGWNMNYCVGCKWNFFCNSTFGIFNNHIEHYQRLWGGGDGWVQTAQTGRTYVVNSSKDDISFLGELRLGGSYDISCNWRAVLAYRAVAITGIANSVDQIPTDFTNSQYPGIIDSDSSIIIHGVQAGTEFRF